MTDEIKKSFKPRKQVLVGAEKINEDWEHPPLQGHEEMLTGGTGTGETVDLTVIGNVSTTQGDWSKPDGLATFECPPGFQTMDSAPKGPKIVVSETGEDQCCVYWRERRVVDKKNLRYIKEGAWTNDFTRLDIDFEPKYWRPYVSSDYFPVARVK